jgi:hypothetical protein
MNARELFDAYCDVGAHGAEHEHYERLERQFGFDPDTLDAVLGKIANRIDDLLMEADTPWWPPETPVGRRTGLAVATKLAVLAALKAVENERKDVPYA